MYWPVLLGLVRCLHQIDPIFHSSFGGFVCTLVNAYQAGSLDSSPMAGAASYYPWEQSRPICKGEFHLKKSVQSCPVKSSAASQEFCRRVSSTSLFFGSAIPSVHFFQ